MATCEDRDYQCCDLTPAIPPMGEMTDEEYEGWYDRHVEAWRNRNKSLVKIKNMSPAALLSDLAGALSDIGSTHESLPHLSEFEEEDDDLDKALERADDIVSELLHRRL